MFLSVAIGTLARGRGRGDSRWLALGQALLAASFFMDAAVSQRRWPLAATVMNDGICGIAVVCLGASVVLMLRSGTLVFRRPAWLTRGSSTPSG
jgi:hypothetical protein